MCHSICREKREEGERWVEWEGRGGGRTRRRPTVAALLPISVQDPPRRNSTGGPSSSLPCTVCKRCGEERSRRGQSSANARHPRRPSRCRHRTCGPTSSGARARPMMQGRHHVGCRRGSLDSWRPQGRGRLGGGSDLRAEGAGGAAVQTPTGSRHQEPAASPCRASAALTCSAADPGAGSCARARALAPQASASSRQAASAAVWRRMLRKWLGVGRGWREERRAKWIRERWKTQAVPCGADSCLMRRMGPPAALALLAPLPPCTGGGAACAPASAPDCSSQYTKR